jgi:hypothetical protein
MKENTSHHLDLLKSPPGKTHYTQRKVLMPKHMFIEGDYILTIDPSMVDEVASFKDTYYFGLSDGSAHVVDKKYTSTIAKLLELVKQNFEVVNTEENKITYKFLSGCVSGKFYLAFADFQSYDSAWNLLEDEFTKRHNAKNGGISHHSDLTFSVSFPIFYDNFKDNKKVIVDLLGNPVNAVETAKNG